MTRRLRYLSSLLIIAVLLSLWTSTSAGRFAAAQVSIDCSALPPPTSPVSLEASEGASSSEVEIEAEFPLDGGELTVFAAASLSNVFTEIAGDIQGAHENVSITFNFAGSQALVTQLSQGARADVFASAGDTPMQAAVDAGVIAGDPVAFAGNQLVIVVPSDNPAGIDAFADLANDGVSFITALAAVPVGQYARQAICLAGQYVDTFGESFIERVAANIVSEEENVTAIVTKISLGEADAGIVYQTDITPDLASSVHVIPIESQVNVVGTYPIALVENGNAGLGRAFIDYLLSPDGQATLAGHGFLTKPE